MARAGKSRLSRRDLALAVAFVCVGAVAYAVGARRASRPPEPPVVAEPAPAAEPTEGAAVPTDTVAPPAAPEAPAEPAAAVEALPAAPPKRAPRDILVVGSPPGPVVVTHAPPTPAPEPEAPPVVANIPIEVPAQPQAAQAPPTLTRSSFDDEDKVDNHPVHSSFDDEDKVEHHPVP